MSTRRWPALIHVNQVWVYDRPVAGSWNRPTKTTIVTTNDAATIAVASQPARGLPSLRPAASRTAKPARGSSGMRNAERSTGPVSPSARGCRRRSLPGGARKIETMIPRPTTTSAAATTSTKKTADLPGDVVQGPGEGDEGEVRGVQHQLDAHEHHEHVAPNEQTDRADREQHRREGEVPGGSDAHGPGTSASAIPAPASASAWDAPVPPDAPAPPAAPPPGRRSRRRSRRRPPAARQRRRRAVAGGARARPHRRPR